MRVELLASDERLKGSKHKTHKTHTPKYNTALRQTVRNETSELFVGIF